MGSFVKFICTALIIYATYSWYVSGAVFKEGLSAAIIIVASAGIVIDAILDNLLKKKDRAGMKFNWRRINYYKP